GALYVPRSVLLSNPAAFAMMARWRKRPNYIDDRTEVVIDGFQRSGNTFAYVAFCAAQDRDVALAHHSHAAGQVVIAARRGLPTVLTVRPPRDVVVSHAQYYPRVSMAAALAAYIAFYRGCLGVLDRVVVAEFGHIVSDMGEVIGRLNERFDSRFRRFEHTEENVAACFERIEERAVAHHGTGILEMVVPRPSEARDARRASLVRRYDSLPRPLRAAAQRLYDTVASTPG
ncbi:MAG: hypothetical protein ACRDNS_26340, partial [Trebonia sp.]